mmetsp:Transcript_144896/g.449813  ORF Transcript_144896/g.449813 Transcript_144896/m.449813 type:complete len:210 (-) Transcript_144896:13-642(-)
MDCSFVLRRALMAPAKHRWQWRHSKPLAQPCGRQNQAHGLHCPISCGADPSEASGVRISSGTASGTKGLPAALVGTASLLDCDPESSASSPSWTEVDMVGRREGELPLGDFCGRWGTGQLFTADTGGPSRSSSLESHSMKVFLTFQVSLRIPAVAACRSGSAPSARCRGRDSAAGSCGAPRLGSICTRKPLCMAACAISLLGATGWGWE